MRTTLDLDDALLAKAQAMFPPGTPKTVLVEEGLRRLVGAHDAAPGDLPSRRDPRMQRLIAEGRVTPAMCSGAPAPGPRGITLKRLLHDLARDREDR